jgi:membrane fusion protein, multidrug efflux system
VSTKGPHGDPASVGRGGRPTSAPRALLIGAAAVLLVVGCTRQEAPVETIHPVQLSQVVVGAPVDRAVFAGEVKPRYETDLGFRIGGKIVWRGIDVGARVRKGQPLARLDPADVALQAEAATAQVAATQTEYEFARAEYERYQNLYAQKFVSASALDAKRNTMNANRARHEQARAQLAVTQNQAGYATLTAPDEGVITAVNAEAGQVVAAGQSVMRLAREGEAEVAIAVPENRIDELRSASEIGVSLWARPQKVYAARVREVSPVVDAATRTFAVRLSILDRDADVQWGMTANAGLRRHGARESALLPLTSIYHLDDGRPAVWVYDPATRKVELRAVGIAQYREDGVVVDSGLATGEWVVSAGVHKLQRGQIVRPYADAKSGAPGPRPPAAPSAAAASSGTR